MILSSKRLVVGSLLARSGARAARINQHLLLALALALVLHGGLLFYSFARTYDAYVHIFFADHYARAWFDHWEYRWYTGFTMTSYPPGAQQLIALLSFLVGLRNGFITVQLGAILLLTVGVYRWARLWVSEEAAGYAALLAVFASSIVETVHVFGQLPTTFSLGFLLNALPFVQRWLREGRLRFLLLAWSLNAATTAGHHVTTLFGAVFFVAPVIVLALLEALRTPQPDEPPCRTLRVTRRTLGPLLARRLRRVLPGVLRAGVYGIGLVAALVLVVLPYWLWSRSDPITQVPIPHASRDSFIANPNAGVVFWLVPYGVSLVALPYVFYKGLHTRAWPLTLSLGMLFFLGTGGTTPFPRMLLRGAYDVLTLDRFTFWATIAMLPLLGEFVVSLRHGRLARYLREQFGAPTWRVVQAALIVAYLIMAVFVANLTQFRRFQPTPIDMQPIVTFLAKDEHWRWRYLTVGMGDQVAWLSAQTMATSVDGNYHSARRLPELVTTPVERLEGAKFRGIPGIGSLQQFLAVPEKYNLKYVFSNDQFYDPLLYFSGWHRLQRLENGIVVWERADIPQLPEVLPRKEIPIYQRLMWGLVPMSAIGAAGVALGLYTLSMLRPRQPRRAARRPRRRLLHAALGPWRTFDRRLQHWSALPSDDSGREIVWQVWLRWLRKLPRPHPAAPTARHVRVALLLSTLLAAAGFGSAWYLEQARTPEAVVQAYYDDLDFRRFEQAYERLDPQTRPGLEQYLLDLSLQGGLVASYGKLDSVQTQVLAATPDTVEIEATSTWITALNVYPTVQRHTLARRGDGWFIVPERFTPTTTTDLFVRRPALAWHQPDHPPSDPALPPPTPDRPDLAILSSRLVQVAGRYSVVGELVNRDADPADVTVTAQLFNRDGAELSRYNAQTVLLHKLLPGETTPFRIDFEGVAGTLITDTLAIDDFQPNAYTPPTLAQPVSDFAVFAKAVTATRDLTRDVATQDLTVATDAAGQATLQGTLFNFGTREATIPQVLITYYDEEGHVAWVDQMFIERAIPPQATQRFAVPLASAGAVTTLRENGARYPSGAANSANLAPTRAERIALPAGPGYAALRVSINTFVGGE